MPSDNNGHEDRKPDLHDFSTWGNEGELLRELVESQSEKQDPDSKLGDRAASKRHAEKEQTGETIEMLTGLLEEIYSGEPLDGIKAAAKKLAAIYAVDRAQRAREAAWKAYQECWTSKPRSKETPPHFAPDPPGPGAYCSRCKDRHSPWDDVRGIQQDCQAEQEAYEETVERLNISWRLRDSLD